MVEDVSRLRQRARASNELRGRLLGALLAERAGLIRGTLGTRARQCGKAHCRCTRGELHESKYLSVGVEGRTRLVHVPGADEMQVATGVERYRRWRSVQVQIVEADRDLMKLLDALAVALLAAYPPGDPIPPPRKRGRRPKKKNGGGKR